MSSDTASSLTEIKPEEVEKNLTDNPEAVSVNYFSLDTPDWVLAVIIAIAAYTVHRVYGNINSLAVITLGVLLMYRLNQGRVYFLFGQWWYSLWIRVVKKGYIHRVEGRRRFRRKARSKSPPFPYELYEIRSTELGDIGLAYNLKTRFDTVIVVGYGSDILAKSHELQNEALFLVSDAIKKIASMVGHKIGVSLVAQKGAVNLEPIARSYARNFHPDVALAPALQKPESERAPSDKRSLFLHEVNIVQLPAELRKHAKDFTMAFVLTIQRDGPLRAIASRRRNELTVREVRRLTATRVAKVAIDELARNGIVSPHVLDLVGLQGYFRSVWDVTHKEEFNQWQTEANEDEILRSDKHWPQKDIWVANDHLVVDAESGEKDAIGNNHAIIQLTESPAKSLPDFYLNLHVPRVRYLSVASVGEPTSYKREYAVLKRGVPIRKSLFEALDFISKDPKMLDKEARMEKRQWDLFRSKYGHSHAIVVRVSETTHERLLEAVEEVMRHYSVHSFGPKLIKGESRQKAALLTSAGIPLL